MDWLWEMLPFILVWGLANVVAVMVVVLFLLAVT